MMVLIFLLTLLVYWPIFKGFFFMDDFYFLQISQASNFKQFVSLFKPIKEIPYRHVSQQFFFFTMQKIFGLNIFIYHLFIFLIHFLNCWFVYRVILKLKVNKGQAKLISLLYSLSPLHFVSLYSITGSYFLFGVSFLLVSFLLWLKYEKEEKKKRFYFCSLIFFILGVFSAEIAAVLPLIILFFSKLKNKLQLLLPCFLIIGLNLFINFFFAGAPKTKAFQLNVSSFPSVLKWYLLRGFGLPEGVRNGTLGQRTIIFCFFAFLVYLLLVDFWLTRRKIKSNGKKILKLILWIIVGALPFYFMPHHLNPVYFSVSLIGFLLLLERLLTPRIFLIYSLSFVILSFFSNQLLFTSHWTVRRSKLAEKWLRKNKQSIKNNQLVLEVPDKDDQNELKITLQDDRAFQLFYNNDSLKTVYKIK